MRPKNPGSADVDAFKAMSWSELATYCHWRSSQPLPTEGTKLLLAVMGHLARRRAHRRCSRCGEPLPVERMPSICSLCFPAYKRERRVA